MDGVRSQQEHHSISLKSWRRKNERGEMKLVPYDVMKLALEVCFFRIPFNFWWLNMEFYEVNECVV